MMRPRFSLRGLLLLTAAVAAFCYWRDRPRQVANQFVTAFQAKDKAAVDALLAAEAKEIFPFAERDAEFTAVVEPQSFVEWLKGERRINFSIEGTWILSGSAIAGARGIHRWDGAIKTPPRLISDSGARLHFQGMQPTDPPVNWGDDPFQTGQPSTLSSPHLDGALR